MSKIKSSKHIINSHKDFIINSQENITSVKMKLQDVKNNNKIYEEYDKQFSECVLNIKMCEEDHFSHIAALSALEDLYQRIKDDLQKNLEDRLTETLNTWYSENVNLKFKTQGTSSKKKDKAVKLLDVNKGVPLVDVTGDAACQTVGLLVAICIARMRGLKFISLDEPFSNFNMKSAKKVPELLKSLIGDMQILLIENKETILNELNAFTYDLNKIDSEDLNSKGTYIKQVINEDMYIPVIE